MRIPVDNELATNEEATAILLETMPDSNVDRLPATAQDGTGGRRKPRARPCAGDREANRGGRGE